MNLISNISRTFLITSGTFLATPIPLIASESGKTDINTKEGVVNGTADDDTEKQLVSKLVADIKGVSSVLNQMKVK